MTVSSRPAAPRSTEVGLALAGGGPQGAIYEIGALRALEEAVDGLDLTDIGVYVGVSAGAFVGANLANGLTTAQMCRAIVKQEPGEHPFVPSTFFTLARREFGKRLRSVPRLLGDAFDELRRGPLETPVSGVLARLVRALPVGVFDNEPIRRYLAEIYSIKGRTDDFRELDAELVIIASDLDSGAIARFGDPPLDHVPISKAVQASGALPGLYPPVEIDGRHYVDGVLRKTLHASIAIDRGAGLLIGLNPLVPIDTAQSVERGIMRRGRLVDRGLVSVLSQSLRTLIHSRMQVGLDAYEKRYGDTDLLLLEPSSDDYRMFFTNIFSFSQRKAVCEHAYASTRRQLLDRFDDWAPMLERHGLTLDRDVLEAPLTLWDGVDRPRRDTRAVLDELGTALDRLDALLADG